MLVVCADKLENSEMENICRLTLNSNSKCMSLNQIDEIIQTKLWTNNNAASVNNVFKTSVN